MKRIRIIYQIYCTACKPQRLNGDFCPGRRKCSKSEKIIISLLFEQNPAIKEGKKTGVIPYYIALEESGAVQSVPWTWRYQTGLPVCIARRLRVPILQCRSVSMLLISKGTVRIARTQQNRTIELCYYLDSLEILYIYSEIYCYHYCQAKRKSLDFKKIQTRGSNYEGCVFMKKVVVSFN